MGGLDLPIGYTTTNITIQKDNADELVLVDNLPPQLTPRSKYYDSDTI